MQPNTAALTVSMALDWLVAHGHARYLPQYIRAECARYRRNSDSGLKSELVADATSGTGYSNHIDPAGLAEWASRPRRGSKSG